jgi:hypothetical protein
MQGELFKKRKQIMYLAKISSGTEEKYCIRKSFYDTHLGAYSYFDVFDLGTDPTQYIHQFSERILCFAEQLEDAVAKASSQDPTLVLEELLWKFLPAEVQLIIEQFHKKHYAGLSPLSSEERQEIGRSIHIFDRRRLYYIRYGAVDQSRIYRVNEKLYRPLLFKSRDEKEHYIKVLEDGLRPDELKKYVYVIFDLQQKFSEGYAAFMPEALEEERMMDMFMEEICRLNEDATFWQDEKDSPSLRKHLQYYLTSFFDSNFTQRSYEYDFYKSFARAHRKFSWPKKNPAVSDEEASLIFGESIDNLRAMSLKELRRIFRIKAKEYHPDSGGKSEDFIQLLAAFETLKTTIRKK